MFLEIYLGVFYKIYGSILFWWYVIFKGICLNRGKEVIIIVVCYNLFVFVGIWDFFYKLFFLCI